MLSKPLENHILKYLSHHISKYDLLHPNQSGFRANHSCHTALTNMIEHFYSNIKNEKLTGVIFADFAKAFDVINHKLLLRKLKHYNISKNFQDIIKSFLSDRTQQVTLSTMTSTFLPQNFGVPQGSILGPLLFSLYINDLPLSISHSLCEMFADDTSLQTSDDNLTNLAKKLQQTVDELTTWTEKNHMALNPSKTKCMLITTSQKRATLKKSLSTIYLKDNIIQEVDSHTVLGITIQKDLCWTIYIDKLSKIAASKLTQLNKIKHFLNLHTRKIFFHSYIQSIIDYTSTLWDEAPACTLTQLFRTYKRAVKQILLKSSSLTPNDYTSLDILPLKLKLKLNKATLMHKIVNKVAPKTLIEKCPKNNKPNYHNELDICSNPRVSIYKKSLHYSGGTLWNSLPKYLRETKQLTAFKSAYKNILLTQI